MFVPFGHALVHELSSRKLLLFRVQVCVVYRNHISNHFKLIVQIANARLIWCYEPSGLSFMLTVLKHLMSSSEYIWLRNTLLCLPSTLVQCKEVITHKDVSSCSGVDEVLLLHSGVGLSGLVSIVDFAVGPAVEILDNGRDFVLDKVTVRKQVVLGKLVFRMLTLEIPSENIPRELVGVTGAQIRWHTRSVLAELFPTTFLFRVVWAKR